MITAPSDRLAGTAVGAQAVLLVWLGWPARRPRHALRASVGRLLSAAGLLVAASAARAMGPGLTPSPVPTEAAELLHDGPFASVRHPIYSGLLVFAVGRMLSAGRSRLLPAGLLTLLLTGKARWEEQLLTARFPDYRQYAASTPRFWPGMPLLRRINPPPVTDAKH
ncbi:isoprenylcysteine carboxylmethyltransferase family protein [Modestobacter muralis]|uniref:Isoprenylcysteine carboxylmethyltransferase family protein n=1 Tax=Modestobacter muralis TaxID=1608614 RepID=A0A6P0EX59_9ACTN|nr:isoprenylcysteine carboxylmethyltransferase family protein [Modestobacter muralis]NEK95156.1 isoprenylcysteine carboxylmethyltransferase family protein [Modestobacter muralis]NEN52044.1 isoprenylcysteine carboxylmethyltransferase family protein [Modestobacter muralis]